MTTTSVTAIVDAIESNELLPRSLEHLRRIGVDDIIVVRVGPLDVGTAGADQRRVPAGTSEGEIVRFKTELARQCRTDHVVFLDSADLLLVDGGALPRLAELSMADTLTIFRYNIVVGIGGPEMPWPLDDEAYRQVLVYARPEASFAELGWGPESPPIQLLQPPVMMGRPEAIGRVQADGQGMAVTPNASWRQRVSKGLLVATVSQVEDVVPAETLHQLQERQIVRSARALLDDPVGDVAATIRTEALSRAQPWLSMAGRVCAVENLAVARGLDPTFPSSYPTVLVPPGHVIKLFPRSGGGHAVLAQEAAGLERAARDPRLPVPALVATGALDDEWHYLVMTRIEGDNLTFLLDELSPGTVHEIATWLGGVMRRLHATELSDAEVDDSRQAFADQVANRHREARERLADRGALPDHLLAQVDAWLPSPLEMLEAPGGPVALHGGLQDDHIMVTSRSERPHIQPVAVIDFGDAAIGHPCFELGPAWWTWLNIDRTYLDAFMRTASFPGWGDPGFPRMALAWTLIRCAWNPKPPPFLQDADDLDELAELAFGANVSRR